MSKQVPSSDAIDQGWDTTEVTPTADRMSLIVPKGTVSLAEIDDGWKLPELNRGRIYENRTFPKAQTQAGYTNPATVEPFHRFATRARKTSLRVTENTMTPSYLDYLRANQYEPRPWA